MGKYVVTIESDGGFTVPSPFLDELGLIPGDEVTLEVKNEQLVVSKVEVNSNQEINK